MASKADQNRSLIVPSLFLPLGIMQYAEFMYIIESENPTSDQQHVLDRAYWYQSLLDVPSSDKQRGEYITAFDAALDAAIEARKRIGRQTRKSARRHALLVMLCGVAVYHVFAYYILR